MKAPRFWQSRDDWRARLLAPLGALWCALARRRVLAYRSGRKESIRLPVPVIAIGNVTVGGTGKTPLTLWLAKQLLDRGLRPAVLSRGYGAKVQGAARCVSIDSRAEAVGDEPLMLKLALPEIEVVVHPQRALAGELALRLGCNVLLLDDGLQHLQLARDLEIAVVDAAYGLGNGRCLPAGPLREPIVRLEEVDAQVVHQGKDDVAHQCWAMRFEAVDAVNLFDGSRQPLTRFAEQPCDALAGIGQPQRFFAMLRAKGLAIDEYAFADHHAFSEHDLRRFTARPLLMTAKDAVKCAPLARQHGWHNHWCVPVDAIIDEGFAEFIFSKLEALPYGQTIA